MKSTLASAAAIASAAIATAAFGTLAIVRKRRAGAQCKSEDHTEADLKSTIVARLGQSLRRYTDGFGYI